MTEPSIQVVEVISDTPLLRKGFTLTLFPGVDSWFLVFDGEPVAYCRSATRLREYAEKEGGVFDD